MMDEATRQQKQLQNKKLQKTMEEQAKMLQTIMEGMSGLQSRLDATEAEVRAQRVTQDDQTTPPPAPHPQVRKDRRRDSQRKGVFTDQAPTGQAQQSSNSGPTNTTNDGGIGLFASRYRPESFDGEDPKRFTDRDK